MAASTSAKSSVLILAISGSSDAWSTPSFQRDALSIGMIRTRAANRISTSARAVGLAAIGDGGRHHRELEPVEACHGRIAKTRAGNPRPFFTFGQVAMMVAPVAGTLSRLAITSIW